MTQSLVTRGSYRRTALSGQSTPGVYEHLSDDLRALTADLFPNPRSAWHQLHAHVKGSNNPLKVPHVGRGRLPKTAYERHVEVSRAVSLDDIPGDYRRRIREVYALDFCFFGYTGFGE